MATDDDDGKVGCISACVLWGVSAAKAPGRIKGDEAHDDAEAAADGPSFPTPEASGDNPLLGAARAIGGFAASTPASVVRSASSAQHATA